MHLGLVGHPRTLGQIMIVLKDYQPNLLFTPIYLVKTDVTEVVDYLKRHENDFDGLIFSGPIPYDLLNSAMFSSKPWVHIRRDPSQLLTVLLQAAIVHHYPVDKITIDSYTETLVEKVFEEFKGPYDPDCILTFQDPIFSEDFLEKLKNFHLNHYVEGKVHFCITGISSVYEYLQSKGVKVLMLDPSTDTILDTYQRLLDKLATLSHKEEAKQGSLVVIAIERDFPSEYALIREDEYQLSLESMKVAEDIYLFAQRIQAAVVEKELGKYLLFTTRQQLVFETQNLTQLRLLTPQNHHRLGTLSIGIGFGLTAREAKYNANLGLLKAKKSGGDQAYSVENNQYTGPIVPRPLSADSDTPSLDGVFQIAANKSGVSINTLLKLQRFMDNEKKDTFTPAELASALGISLRSTNRLLEKLLSVGYGHIIGRNMRTDTGRPSRIIQLNFINLNR